MKNMIQKLFLNVVGRGKNSNHFSFFFLLVGKPFQLWFCYGAAFLLIKLLFKFIVQMSIGRKWKEIMDFNDKIVYSFHVCHPWNSKPCIIILLYIITLDGYATSKLIYCSFSRLMLFILHILSLHALCSCLLQDDSRREKSSRGGRYSI